MAGDTKCIQHPRPPVASHQRLIKNEQQMWAVYSMPVNHSVEAAGSTQGQAAAECELVRISLMHVHHGRLNKKCVVLILKVKEE